MGLKDLLFGGRSKIDKHVARARNKDAQSVDRFASLEALKNDGSPEAVLGLLGRFTIRYDKSIDDETEKDYVFAALVYWAVCFGLSRVSARLELAKERRA